MINNFKNNILLILIILVSLVLRFAWLDRYPVSLNVDEVAIGYDAYSILKSGYDSHQKFMPLVFESLGDFKPGLYIYLAAVSEFIFGVNEFGVRFPSALAGVITVLFTYLTINLLTNNKKLSLISALVIATSPWHIKLSRGAFESNLAFCLLLVGLYYTVKAIESEKKFNTGIFFMGLSMYAYHTEKILAPLLVACVLFVFRKKILNKGLIKYYLVTFVIILSPFLFLLNSKDQTRAVSKFVRNDPEINITLDRITRIPEIGVMEMSGILIFKRYIEVFDIGHITNKALDLTHSVNFDLGWIYWLELPFLIVGTIYLLKGGARVFKSKDSALVFVAWLLLSPIPASITMDDYHMYRLLTLAFPLSFLIGLGIYRFINYWKKSALKEFSYLVILVIYAVNLVYFADYYLIQFPLQKSDWLFDPSKAIAKTVLNNIDRYDKIVIDPNFGKLGPNTVGVPMLYILFYGKVVPADFNNKDYNWLSKIDIRKIDWRSDRFENNTLLIASPWSLPAGDIPQNLVVEKFNFWDGSPAYLAVKSVGRENLLDSKPVRQ